MKRYQRKGFTLLELIIVIALFAIIMVSVVKLLDPVSKFFVRSANFETTNACIDNMRRSIEGNLQYADRVYLCEGYEPYTYTVAGGVKTSDYKPTDDLKDKVQQFYNDFFLNRKFLKSIGSIYVLVFDNEQIATDAGLKKYQVLSDINSNKLNTGKMVRYEFKFDNYKSSAADRFNPDSYTTLDWYVNQNLYGNFEYKYTLGAIDTGSIAGLDITVFDPKDCTISITMNEIKKSSAGLVREAESKTDTASFSMKNVLDAAQKYNAPLNDFITKESAFYPLTDWSDSDTDPNILEWFESDETPIPRYKRMTPASSFDGFYFIYTMPETTYDILDFEGSSNADYLQPIKKAKAYIEAVKNKYD